MIRVLYNVRSVTRVVKVPYRKELVHTSSSVAKKLNLVLVHRKLLKWTNDVISGDR